jgi:hypothetical protein
MIVRIQCGTVRHYTRSEIAEPFAEIVELLAWCVPIAAVAIAGLLYLALH